MRSLLKSCLACTGDAGGPAVIINSGTKVPTQFGIVSWSKRCGLKGFPDVYARVLAAREWIQEKTQI